MSTDLAAVRARILEAALRHVPFDGWSERTLRLALEACGLDRATARRAFPGGAAALLDFFAAESDRRMVEALAGRDLAPLKVRERIALAVRLHITVHAAHREALRRALAAQSLPWGAGHALRHLYRTVDAIWHAIGDSSTDFSFYTKRALLAGVYGATLLYWLDDGSEGAQETWRFLDRRVDDVMRIQKTRGRAADLLKRLTPARLAAGGAGRLR